ncbi:glycerol-3-phosphate 1-O-acyltransferase PlsY [Pseudopelagicola sp. nBUS_19]|uniref:glycerol-3-phosphate 1-O-acyltransferase PlsY n=1 Tax=unclassified Pseudopelagicola TaxID=2649563 RepID=UPI003EB9C507
MPIIENTPTVLLLSAMIGYFMGSIPFGMIISRAMGLGNLRDIGSGNIGATNVLRTGSKSAAAVTLLLDGGKGVVAVVLTRVLAGEDAAQISGLLAFLGHCYPVWLGFKGGKGVATFLGLMLALAWPAGIACCMTWVITAAVSRVSSMSSLIAAATSTFWLVILDHGNTFFLGIILSLLLFWRHRENIRRLRNGTEPKIGEI